MAIVVTAERSLSASPTRVLAAALYDVLTADPRPARIQPRRGAPAGYEVVITVPETGAEIVGNLSVHQNASATDIDFSNNTSQGVVKGKFRITMQSDGSSKLTVTSRLQPSALATRENLVSQSGEEEKFRLILDRVEWISQLIGAPGRQLRQDVLATVAPIVEEAGGRKLPSRHEIEREIEHARANPDLRGSIDRIMQEEKELLDLSRRSRSQLRHYAVTVQARGPAVRVVNRAVVRYAMARGDVLGYAMPGQWIDPKTDTSPDAHLLLVPLSANAKNYPRSINGTAVRITRVAPTTDVTAKTVS